MFPGFRNKKGGPGYSVPAAVCTRECVFQTRTKTPVAAEVLKATDHLLNPPPSLAGVTHPTHAPFSPPAFYVVDSTVRPLQTTINMSVPDDRVGLGTFYIN